MFYFSHYIYICMYRDGGDSLIIYHGWADRTDSCPAAWLEAKQKLDKPLGEDGGRCPCCYASTLVL